MTIAFGQGAANGELGLGPEEPKSSTKPTKNQPLAGIDVFQYVDFAFNDINKPRILMPLDRVAAGQNTTLFLAHPNDKFSDLPRHPLEMEQPEVCVVCNKDNGEDDSPLECDKVSCFSLPHLPRS